MENQDEPVLPYVAFFAAAYVVLTIIVGVILVAFDLPTNSGIGIAIVIASAAYVGAKFAKDKGRAFSRSERLRITGLSFLVSVALSVLLFAGFVVAMQVDGVWDELSAILRQISLPFLVGIVAFVTVVHLLGLYFTYGFITKQVLTAMKRKEQA